MQQIEAARLLAISSAIGYTAKLGLQLANFILFSARIRLQCGNHRRVQGRGDTLVLQDSSVSPIRADSMLNPARIVSY
jgi:hypothetical protein